MYIKPFGWEPDMPFKARPETRYLVVHHLAGPDQSAAQIDAQERRDFGFLAIGYHLVIRKDGSLEEGRPLWVIGAQAINHNFESVGVCLTGDFTRETPTEAQMESLVWVLKDWQQKFPGAVIKPHRELSPTRCPGELFPWDDLMKRMEGGDMPEQWKIDIINQAKEAGLIPEDFNPDEKVQVWFVLATELNLLKKILKEA